MSRRFDNDHLHTERWLSWSKAHDWKSCVRLTPTEGSNPSLSATLSLYVFCVQALFFLFYFFTETSHFT